MLLRVALRANDGQYVAAESGGGRNLVANRTHPGRWEVFRLYKGNAAATGLRHGDRVSFQAFKGQFVVAEGGGGGVVNANRERIGDWEAFTVERVDGAGLVGHNDRVALKAPNGQYVVAEGGGGGAVNADRNERTSWETFRLEYWPDSLVRFQTSTGHFVVAEGGGGRVVAADRTQIGRWETFTLFNRSGVLTAPRHGDRVVLQAWNGQFFVAEGGGGGVVNANRDFVTDWETLTIERVAGPGAIAEGDAVALKAANGQYLAAEGGGGDGISANRDSRTSWETFRLTYAERRPISVSHTLVGSELSGAPLSDSRAVTGTRPVVTLMLAFSDLTVPPVTAAQVDTAIFGPAPSLKRWVEAMSFARFTLSRSVTAGPVQMPRPFSFYNAPSMGIDPSNPLISDALAAAEAAGFSFAPVPRGTDGVVDTSEASVFVLNLGGGLGGTRYGLDATAPGGTRFRGTALVMGCPALGGAFQAVLWHEAAHLFFDTIDRYSWPIPVRGDVIANRIVARAWEVFTLARVGAGTGALRSGQRISLLAHNGRYVVAEGGGGGFVNANRDEVTSWETFTIERRDGAGEIVPGDAIRLRAANGQYLVAELGGGSIVAANRAVATAWETFTIERPAGTSAVSPGDVVNLKTANGYYVVAETDARTTDPKDLARGYRWNGAGGGPGGPYDLMDDSRNRSFLCAFDRIRRGGWIPPRYVTPESHGCFKLRPSADQPEALILWDPLRPIEYYVVENRQARPNFDEVPSSGLIVTWVCLDPAYWDRWLRDPDDERPGRKEARTPAVLSAAARTVPPNQLAAPFTFDPKSLFKRYDVGAAFTSGELVLPKGDGSPSRFHLSFAPAGDGIAICVR